ncbi:MAG: phytanoyl-CoA dioxygenase family protein [Pseudomonadota bacterium]
MSNLAMAGSTVSDYKRDGIVCLRNVIDQEWLDCLRKATDLAMQKPGPFSEFYGTADPPLFFGDLNSWWRVPEFERYIRESPTASNCAAVMQSGTARFFYDQLLVKEIGCSDRTPWHQDQPYWAVSGQQIISAWVPMDPVPLESAIEFVAGSHKWNEFNPRHFNDATPYEGTGLPSLPDIEADRTAYNILSFAMEPGDALVFQAMIVHGAPGNASNQHRRRAYSTRWLGDDARFCDRPGEVAMPNFATGLSNGDVYSGERFPLVYSRT